MCVAWTETCLTRVKAGKMEVGSACCRAVSGYSLHTMTNLCPDELECDKNAGLGRAAKTGMKSKDDISIRFLRGFT